MLPLGGLHGKHAVQRGIWVPTQHLLWDQGKPSSWLVAGPSGCKLTSSQQSGIKSANPNISPYSFVSFSFFLFFSFFFFSQQVILFLQLFVCAYDLDKQQTLQNTYGRNKDM
jgi:hypothetical protein